MKPRQVVALLAQEEVNCADLGKLGPIDQAIVVLMERLEEKFLPQQAIWMLGALAKDNDKNRMRMIKLEIL